MVKDQQKVFCIGFMKTGTTTMNRALEILGYRVSDKSWRLLYPIATGNLEALRAHAEAWDALEDNPIPQVYKELDQMFPGSKFILTKRDTDQWYKSVNYHIGNLRSVMHEWVYGKGKGLPKEDEAHTKKVFDAHNASVMEYFKDRPKDLLVIDITQVADWEPICSFLKLPTPKVPFPHANQSQFARPKHGAAKQRVKLLKKRIFNPIKIIWYSTMGYLPSPDQRTQS